MCDEIVSGTSTPFIGKLALAAEDYAHSCGYNLIVYNTHGDVDREKAYFSEAVERSTVSFA